MGACRETCSGPFWPPIAGRPTDFRQSESAAQKCACIDSKFQGKSECQLLNFPGFAGHRPAFHGGFCVSRWAVLHGRRMPADLPVGRDLTIRRKIENGRYYCAVGTRIESGHHVALNPRAAEAAAEGTCAWRPTRRSIASAPYQPPGQERPVAGSPRHLTLGRAACGRHGGGEGSW